MKKALEQGDIGVIVGGTKTAQTLFSMFKLNDIKKSAKFFRVFNPWLHFKYMEGDFLRKLIKTMVLMPSTLIKIKRRDIYSDVELIKNVSGDSAEEVKSYAYFYKKKNKNYVSWLLKCPILKTYSFHIKKGDKNLGTCVFYIKKLKFTSRGRIIYLPNLGNDLKLWRSVLYKALEFFKANKCCVVTSLASNHVSKKGYSTGMLKSIVKIPIFLKDTKNLITDFDLNTWDIQYIEGDRGYLHI